MGITQLGGIKVSRLHPRITVRVVNAVGEFTTAYLRLQRVGAPHEFAEYLSVSVSADIATFVFDDLLFTQPVGRYLAKFIIDDEVRAEFFIQLEEPEKMVIANA